MDEAKIERRMDHLLKIDREIGSGVYHTDYGRRMAQEFWTDYYDNLRDIEHEDYTRTVAKARRKFRSHPNALNKADRRRASVKAKHEYLHWFRTLRKGQVVSACYDGKRGRAVDARVVKSHKGVVVAEFVRWGRDSLTRVRFVDGGGWDRGGDYMPTLGVSRRGDFYQLVPWIEPNRTSGSAATVRKLVEIVTS